MSAAATGELLGRVGRAHGRDGSFYLDHPRRAPAVGDLVDAGGREYRVERRAGTDARPIVRLSGVEDRDRAAALRGVPLADLGSPAGTEADEWRVEELVGCRVEGVGEVRRVIAAPSCDILEVGEEGLLIPLVRDAVRRVDTDGRRIEVDRVFLGLEQRAADPDAGEAGGGAPAR